MAGDAMIVEWARQPATLSNTWLAGDGDDGHAVIVDAGGPIEPILAAVARHRLTVTHVLCTHHHPDHVEHLEALRARFDAEVCAHAAEPIDEVDHVLADGDELQSGTLSIRVLHVPGHTAGGLAFVVATERVFTGDTLFRRSVGGTRGPGATTFEDLRRSVLDVLLALPADTIVHPGHMNDTTIGEERAHNPFVRVWQGLDPTSDRPCVARGQRATLLLRAPDYDGGTKCWVRFDDGRYDVVGGSQVRG
jgi:glyoxylase-like metal-dependent hydrolase (beta-lactamase superfamily II)